MKTCSHCVRAERAFSSEPITLVTGKLNGRPYRGYLCQDHFQMLLDDGLTTQKRPVFGLDDARMAYRDALRTLVLDSAGIRRLDFLRDQLWTLEIDAHVAR